MRPVLYHSLGIFQSIVAVIPLVVVLSIIADVITGGMILGTQYGRSPDLAGPREMVIEKNNGCLFDTGRKTDRCHG